ncbi:MAG: photosystem II biogenesis protein Psp29 [Microcystaceae cyanobacterium]
MDTIRTVSDTKRAFYHYHTRPINSIYRRVVEELMVEMHLLSVNVDFTYDPIYALGVVTSFEKFMEGYQPQDDRESIFNGLCQSVEGDSNQYRQDAERILNLAKEISLETFLSSMGNDSADIQGNELIGILQGIAQKETFKYSRLFAIGLYTLMVDIDPELIKSEDKRKETLDKLSETLNLPPDKLQKDLELYRGNLEKMAQLLQVLEDTLEAERKKRQKQEQEAQEKPTPSDSVDKEESVES